MRGLLSRMLVVAALICAAGLPSTAQASSGLTPGGCLAVGQSGCGSLTSAEGALIYNTMRVVVAPNGRDAYSVGQAQSADGGKSAAGVVHFKRASDGALTWADCAGAEAICAVRFPDAANPVAAPTDVAISSDGSDLYVVGSGNLTRFRLAADGSLRFADCLRGHHGEGDCQSMPFDTATQMSALDYPQEVTVTPDDRNVIVAEFGGLTNFTRAADGSLTIADCLGEAGADCSPIPKVCPSLCGTGFSSVTDIAISPDGSDLYTVGTGDDAIGHVRRAPDGTLSYAGCFSVAGAPECDALPAGLPLVAPTAVAVSPDGRSVYVGGHYPGGEDTRPSHAILRFSRGVQGALAYADCAGHSGAPGCAPVPDADPLGIVGSLLPLGGTLVASSQTSGLTTTLATAADGSLSYRGCMGGDGDPRDVCDVGPAIGANTRVHIGASPDGGTVYGTRGARLDWLSRTAAATPAAAAPTVAAKDASQLDATRALAQADIDPHGGVTRWHVEWGTTTAYGHATADQSAGAGRTPQPEGLALTALVPGTTYHVRVVAANSAGTATGADRAFTTPGTPVGDGAGARIDLLDANPADVPNNALAVADDGTLWVSGFSAPPGHFSRIAPDGTVRQLPSGATPVDLVRGPDGTMWGATGHDVIAYAPDGTVARRVPIDTPDQAPWLQALTITGDGTIWLIENGPPALVRLTRDGAITRFPIASSASDLTEGPDGNVWFTEGEDGAIGSITPTGVIRRFALPDAASDPSSITTGSDGALWFTERHSDRVGRITTAGAITERRTPTTLSGPNAITAGPHGHLFFTEGQRGRIGELDPTAGTILEHAAPGLTYVAGVAASGDTVWFGDRRAVGRIVPLTAPKPGAGTSDPAAGGAPPEAGHVDDSPAPVGTTAPGGDPPGGTVSPPAALSGSAVAIAPSTGASRATIAPSTAPKPRIIAPAVLRATTLRVAVAGPSGRQWAVRLFRATGGRRVLVATLPFRRIAGERWQLAFIAPSGTYVVRALCRSATGRTVRTVERTIRFVHRR